jgi:hypothetical protein
LLLLAFGIMAKDESMFLGASVFVLRGITNAILLTRWETQG